MEALKIRKELAKVNPQTYLPDVVVMAAINVSIYYLKSTPDQEKSIYFAKEAIQCALAFSQDLPDTTDYIHTTLQVVKAWGLDEQAFLQEIMDEDSQEQA